MNTEQERAEFEAWHTNHIGYTPTFIAADRSYVGFAQERYEAFQAGRAALQSQDREDAERFRFCLQHGFPQKWEEMVRGNLSYYWTSRPGSQEEFSSPVEAIDHARRIEENE